MATDPRIWSADKVVIAIAFTLVGALVILGIITVIADDSFLASFGTTVTQAPDPYVVWCERLWTGPENGHHVVVMVWSDGEIWAAQSDHLASWNPLTTVRHE